MKGTRLKPPDRNRSVGVRAGLTLIELVVSVAVGSILIVGVGSSIYIANRATDVQLGPYHNSLEGGAAAFDITTQLQFALSFTERTATAVAFTVADRNADAAPETIRYAWSGIVGDPLTRQYNGGTVVNVAEDVQEFKLDYSVQSVAQSNVEIELASHLDPTNTYSGDFLQTARWVGQYFVPSGLPADAISWSVTHIKFQAKKAGSASGITGVQLRTPASGNLPSSNVLEEYLLYESDLTNSYTWQKISFSNVSGMAPGAGLCLVLESVSGDISLWYRWANSGADLLMTSDAGASWTLVSNMSLEYYVYGTVTTKAGNLYYLTRVGITVRVGADSRSRVNTGTNVLNRPEVSGP